MRNPFKPVPCEHCGASPIAHGPAKFNIRVGEFLNPAFESGERGILSVIPDPAPVGDLIFPPLFALLSAIGGGRMADRPEDDDMLLTQCLWEEADKRGIRVREFRPFGAARNLFTAEHAGKRITYEGVPFPASAPRGVWWLDDKAVLKERFAAAGFPVSRGKACRSLPEALEAFRTLGKPVIAKPHHGSGTRHTTLHIEDEDALAEAFAIAFQVSPAVMIEEELAGDVFRPTLVAGKLEAVIRRDPPHITGDGERTVRELIEAENEHPKRQGPHFSRIGITPAVEASLTRAGLSLDAVPEKGRRVRLHQKINWSVGGTTADATDDVHPDNAALFEAIAAHLHAPLVGIDFIIEDIGRSWKEQERCGVIECNSMPFFDNHHLPFSGQPRNVAGAIWDMVFPASAGASKEA